MKIARLNVTKTERPIVVLMARGYKPKQIAAMLGMTDKGVCSARRRILDRNGITNDTQLGMLIEQCKFVSLYERNLIEDRREDRIAHQNSPPSISARIAKASAECRRPAAGGVP